MTTTAHDEIGHSPLTPFQGLTFAIDRLEAIVRRALASAEAVHGPAGQDPFRGLHLDAGAIDRALAQPPGAPLFSVPTAPDDSLVDAAPSGSRLAWLSATFGLSRFDLDVLIVALGPELDPRYERIFAYLQDDVTRRRPTVNLALDLLAGSREEKLQRRSHFSASGPLLDARLIEWMNDPHHADPSLLSSSFRADEQIVRYVLGQDGLDSRLARCARLVTPVLTFAGACLEPSVASELQTALERAEAGDGRLTLDFHGCDESARSAAAHAAATSAGRRLLIVDMNVASDWTALLPVVFREAALNGAVLLIERWDLVRAASDPGAFRQLQSGLATHAGLAILSAEPAWSSSPHGPKGVVAFDFSIPSYLIRTACWQDGLAVATGEGHEALAQALGSRFRLGVEQIWDAVLTAQRLAQNRAGAGAAAPVAADFFAAARRQAGDELASVATRIDPAATWHDIVLPDDAVTQLHEVCSRVSLAHRVLGDWGFDRRLSHGKGVTALFSGPSGTGKTMAAEVVANELGLDLYRVEIPAVVSKWIGETEKNLDKVFRLARNAILFFDEADALFGKRSEVRDAHDRYANVEVSYLLQRMETFEGLAILATNVRHHMDEAFLRRLSFVIQFPFPDDAQRQRIWQRIWPAETPVSANVDVVHLARSFRFAGGNVKNVALAAAFAAAARGGPIEMVDVLHAVRREYQKLGKTLGDAELSYGAALSALTGARV